MRKILTPLVAWVAVLLSALPGYCQVSQLTGTIRSSVTKEIVPAASVVVKGGITGTFTDDKGNFRLGGSQKFPLTLVISSVGYETQEVSVTDPSAHLDIELKPSSMLGTEVVVSASRVPERIMESPVSVEQVTNATIRNSPASSYYDVIGNLKGVDMTTSSLTFKTPSTRGFNGSGNVRMNQIVDGMDNQAPGLNFSLGNVVGPSDIDVDHMELLEGASSALYGPGGMNGTLVINSKDPFKYQGISAMVREGVMNINSPVRNASPYTDISLRWGQKIGDRFAFKITGQYIEATDWVAYDSSNYSIPNAGYKQGGGGRNTDPAYDGVNLYGDEYNSQVPTMSAVADQIIAGYTNAFTKQYEAMFGVPPPPPVLQGYLSTTYPVNIYYNNRAHIPNQYVTRTGYREADIIDPKTKNLRLSGAAYYKINDRLTASVQANWATGNTVYTGSDRYSLKNLYMGQYKVELKSKNWFLRGYTTQENAGDAFNSSVNTELLNEAWKPTSVWLPEYVAAYALAGGNTNDLQAQQIARNAADQGRPLPGSARFNQIADSIAKIPIPNGGRFLDKSSLYMVEGQYNFTDALGLREKGTDILIGGNWKQYVLNSEGTLFADSAGPIHINEYGAYAQVSQRLFGDLLKLSVSGRYDKNQNFDGQFTPRATAVIQVAKNHNFRLSYQSAYRFPTTQNQYINLRIGGSTTLIGGLPQLRDFYHFNSNPPYTLASFQTFTVTHNPNDLVIQQFGKYKPESMNSFEVGYKGLMLDDRLLADVYVYFGKYMNLLTRITCVQPSDTGAAGFAAPNIFSVSVNSPNSVNTDGWGASLEYLLDNNFYVSGNVFSDEIKNVPVGFKAYFNTPKYRCNVGFGNKGFGPLKRLGFNLIWRWQDSFFTESDFIQGNVPSFSTVDAQVSYKLTPIKSIIKLGATNLTNHYYINASGNPAIGGLYYVSFAYNVF